MAYKQGRHIDLAEHRNAISRMNIISKKQEIYG